MNSQKLTGVPRRGPGHFPRQTGGDLAACLADLVYPYHPGEQQFDRLRLIAFSEDIPACRDVCMESLSLEVTQQLRIGMLKDGQGLRDAGELFLGEHDYLIISL